MGLGKEGREGGPFIRHGYTARGDIFRVIYEEGELTFNDLSYGISIMDKRLRTISLCVAVRVGATGAPEGGDGLPGEAGVGAGRVLLRGPGRLQDRRVLQVARQFLRQIQTGE